MMTPSIIPVLRGSAGFTLIEMMVTVVVATLLVTLAVTAYTGEVQKSRRTDAKTALLDLAGREEQFYSTNNSYATTPAQLGYNGAAFPQNVGSNYYSVNVCVPATAAPCSAAAAAAPSFMVIATPINGQTSDASCQLFSVDSTGKQAARNSGGTDTTATCWQ